MDYQKIIERINEMYFTAKSDDCYMTMLVKLRELEVQYEQVLQSLPYPQRDIICDYLSLCGEMDHRLLVRLLQKWEKM